MLVKCAKGVDATTQFSVVEVEQLAVHIENPRTKCWKVVVPYKYKEMREKDELYPPGWTHRKFFGPRKSAQNKSARQDDQIVTEVINEKAKENESLASDGAQTAGSESK